MPQRCRGDQQVVDQRTAQCNHEWHISSRAAQHRRTLHETGRWLALTMARTSSDTLPKRRLKVDRRLPRGRLDAPLRLFEQIRTEAVERGWSMWEARPAG